MAKIGYPDGERLPKITGGGNQYFADRMSRIDIVLPVYKPLPGWEEMVLQRMISLQQRLPADTISLIIVNDGTEGLESSASWQELAEKIPGILLTGYPENRGKGYALRFGVKQATGDFILYTDVDWPYTEDSMVHIISALRQGADAAIGVRDARYYRHLPAARRLISKALRRFNRLLLKLKVDDTQAGLKGFHPSLAGVFTGTSIDRYLFDLEFVYQLSHIRHLRIVACPVALREGIRFSTMNRKILWQEARNFLRIWRSSRALPSEA